MSVERRTPMMDLLVQITSAHRINPGGHVIQVINDRSDDFLYYKPSTPIGALDTNTIHIVPKNKINESVVKKAPMKILNQPFETTFRLQVRLPRNQLAVLRVSPKTAIAEVLKQVCYDKGLDIKKYDDRHPDNYDEQLRPECTLSDYRIAEVAVCSVNSKGMPSSSNASMSSRSVSTSDILRLQQQNQSNANLSNPSIIDHSGSGRRVGNTRL